MKLPIQDKWFKQIKEGKKFFEVRDGHITFVNEKTGETIIKYLVSAGVGTKEKVLDMAKLKAEDVKDCVTEDNLLYFYW